MKPKPNDLALPSLRDRARTFIGRDRLGHLLSGLAFEAEVDRLVEFFEFARHDLDDLIEEAREEAAEVAESRARKDLLDDAERMLDHIRADLDRFDDEDKLCLAVESAKKSAREMAEWIKEERS